MIKNEDKYYMNTIYRVDTLRIHKMNRGFEKTSTLTVRNCVSIPVQRANLTLLKHSWHISVTENRNVSVNSFLPAVIPS